VTIGPAAEDRSPVAVGLEGGGLGVCEHFPDRGSQSAFAGHRPATRDKMCRSLEGCGAGCLTGSRLRPGCLAQTMHGDGCSASLCAGSRSTWWSRSSPARARYCGLGPRPGRRCGDARGPPSLGTRRGEAVGAGPGLPIPYRWPGRRPVADTPDGDDLLAMSIPAVCMWGVGTVIFGKSPQSLVAFRVALLLFGVALIAVGVQFLRGGQVAGGVVPLLGGSGVLVTVMSLL